MSEPARNSIPYLEVSSTQLQRPIRIRVKTRTKGTWQCSASDGNPSPPIAPIPIFWVFVDLAQQPVAFFIVPDDVVRRDIYAAHEAYLARHGGRRAENQESDHHAIRSERVASWQSRWDLLGMG